jgi:lipase
LIDWLQTSLGQNFTLIDVDCDHMVPLARPDESAAAVLEELRRA